MNILQLLCKTGETVDLTFKLTEQELESLKQGYKIYLSYWTDEAFKNAGLNKLPIINPTFEMFMLYSMQFCADNFYRVIIKRPDVKKEIAEALHKLLDANYSYTQDGQPTQHQYDVQDQVDKIKKLLQEI